MIPNIRDKESYLNNIVEYLKKNSAKGYSLESLKWALISQGYSRGEVDKAVKIAEKELAKPAPKVEEKPVIKVERISIEEKKSFFSKLFNWKS